MAMSSSATLTGRTPSTAARDGRDGATVSRAAAEEHAERRVPRGHEEKTADADGDDDERPDGERVAEDAGEVREARGEPEDAHGRRHEPPSKAEPAHHRDPDAHGAVG